MLTLSYSTGVCKKVTYIGVAKAKHLYKIFL